MRALEMQAKLLELRGLGWRHICLVSGWTWAMGAERCWEMPEAPGLQGSC